MTTVSRFLRRQAMDNPLLYRIWFKRYRRKKKKTLRLTSREDHLYFDGFPRSGNTYFAAALNSLFPDLKFAHHRHCLAPLKIAIAKSVPSFVLMRKPKDAIASRILQIKSEPGPMQSLPNQEILKRLLNDWRRYYSYCERNASNLVIISFEDAVKNPYSCLRGIAEALELDGSHVDEKRFLNFHEQFREHDRTKKQGSTSYPDKIRSDSKKAFVPAIECSSEYFEVASIYDRLRVRSMAIK